MGWLDKLRAARGLLDTVGQLVAGAADLASARKLLAKAAERGDLDGPLQMVLDGQARARTYERSGR